MVFENWGCGFKWAGNSCFLDTVLVVLRPLATAFGTGVLHEDVHNTPTMQLIMHTEDTSEADRVRDEARLVCPYLIGTGCGGVGPGAADQPGSMACVLNGALSEEAVTNVVAIAVCDHCYKSAEVTSSGRTAFFSTVQLARNLRVSMANVDEVIMANG